MHEQSKEFELTAEEAAALDEIAGALGRFGQERGNLIPILQMVQERLSYLPPRAIELVASHLGMAPCEVYGVATFYNQFRFHPPGRYRIKVCLGTACHVKGGDIILENFERKLGIRDGETTPDREFSIERVACVGCCALAPVTVINETVHGHTAPSKVEGLLLGFQIERERKEREDKKHADGESQDH
ncbi:MAG: NADH-quinone oxidoreductase subunit NuoE [Deltaproteobacteria bacterium]|nr:NADH-quinone oxidoreductase subunit NuoE [Deltaproteobacteria bacterium]MBW1922369.1 NADH-quinone oxidoreductase subunit NuoE [Deltaproteobacteria bacterium]MBW2102837.1 NADH-quinone oxidoreductase subunit NuoE [Deltaproteobacteria bacterium]MBW2348463.1 NADH-quinone oxidoreductase subunit NuoE [Deltaproteobacteria bacterium]RLB38559.1 MAG: NADH-quinone oxidoreductase subunit NuoE [Deltaproteobacteria bacterium]